MSDWYLLPAVLLNGNQLIPRDWHGPTDTRSHPPHARSLPLRTSSTQPGGPRCASSGRVSKCSSQSGFQVALCKSGSTGRGLSRRGWALGFGKEEATARECEEGGRKRRRASTADFDEKQTGQGSDEPTTEELGGLGSSFLKKKWPGEFNAVLPGHTHRPVSPSSAS